MTHYDAAAKRGHRHYELPNGLENMCGIAGLASGPNGPPLDRGALERMTATLQHRGPDGDGFFYGDRIGLGHRRLSIIDLEGGDQPIFNEDGSVVIVFNGEIYNYKELQADLIRRGHTLRTRSDTEVIVHLYEELGTDCLRELNGMFAFALWDMKREQLFLARDRLGEKPLYFAPLGHRLAFGSELKAVLEATGVDREVDPEALDDYLAYGYVPAPRTIFRAVSKLPAAHYMVWRGGEQHIERYWTPDDENLEVPSHPEEAAAELRRLLEDAVRIRLRSDVPLGAFLSGGLDSSLIVALASRQATIPLQTFTVTFAEQDYDEAPYAAMVAEHCGTEHRTIPVADLDLGIIPELVKQYDEPFADPSAVPTFYVTREARRHVKVCLSGDGGDELFGGYRRYRWEPLERTVGRLPHGTRQAVLGTLGRRLPHSVPGKGWLQRMAASGAERLQRKVGIFDPAERRALLRPEIRPYVRDDAWFIEQHYAKGRCELSRRMAADRGTYLPEDVLTKVDRDSMANSLEVRVPLLDHRIVAFADRLAFELKIRNGEQKYLLKRVLRDLVPPTILSRDKRGFGMPLKHWLADGRLDDSLAMLTSSDSRSGALLDRSEIQRLARAHRSGRRDLSGRLWALIWLEHWCRERV